MASLFFVLYRMLSHCCTGTSAPTRAQSHAGPRRRDRTCPAPSLVWIKVAALSCSIPRVARHDRILLTSIKLLLC